MSDTTINARIDSETKTKAVNILHSLGLNTTQAISLFFKQIIYTRSIPFEIKIPNKITAETLEKAEKGKDVYGFDNVDKMLQELKG
jgi:DNA-damage-inducible protein J